MMGEKLTSSELAKRYKRHQQTIYRWEKRGLPFERLGSGQKLYDLDEVKKWHKKNKERRKS